MANATETLSKAAAETKDVVIDCAGDLATLETIDAIVGSIAQSNGDGGAALTITGAAINAATITEPGKRPIGVSQAILFFVSGGTANVTYTLTATYTTSTGQSLQAVIKLRIT